MVVGPTCHSMNCGDVKVGTQSNVEDLIEFINGFHEKIFWEQFCVNRVEFRGVNEICLYDYSIRIILDNVCKGRNYFVSLLNKDIDRKLFYICYSI